MSAINMYLQGSGAEDVRMFLKGYLEGSSRCDDIATQTMRDIVSVDDESLPSVMRVSFPQEGLLGTIVGAVFGLIESIKRHNIRVSVDIPPDLFFQDLVKRNRLHRIIVELVENAIKYSDPQKPVKAIAITWEGQEKRLLISDNGIGIRDKQRVWNEGVREADRAPWANGVGMGLALVRDLMRRIIGGEIYCLTEVNKGTTFVIYPIAEFAQMESAGEDSSDRPPCPEKAAPTIPLFTDAPDRPLPERLNLAWDTKDNAHISVVDTIDAVMGLTADNLARTGAVLDCIVDSLIAKGRRAETLTAAVCAHGPLDVYAIQFLLRRGLKVVSRETEANQDLIVLNHDLSDAVASGQLILSPFDKGPHPKTPYDLVIWSHPTPVQFPSGLGGPHRQSEIGLHPDITPDMLVENLSPGGLLLVQTDTPDQFIDPFRPQDGFRVVWKKTGLHGDNYLFPSIEIGRHTPALALIERITKD